MRKGMKANLSIILTFISTLIHTERKAATDAHKTLEKNAVMREADNGALLD